jgi:hypothetical protein
MFFWFIGTVVLAVWFVFRDPAFDYRLLVVGAVLPLGDWVLGGARVLHGVTFSVALLTLVMLATSGRRPVRKLLLGLPIGILLHLVFTGAWTDTRVFWWPLLGTGFDGAEHPVASRGWWNVPLELVGFVLCWWIVERCDLRDPERRARFWRTGQLALPQPGDGPDRSVVH